MKVKVNGVYGIYPAILGMRNPLNSHNKSDSYICESDVCENCNDCKIGQEVIGPKDLLLAQKLVRAGNEHRKFLRQIMVSIDLVAPTYFFAELDTYKIGTTRNSSSFMHTGTRDNVTLEDFEKVANEYKWELLNAIESVNTLIDLYNRDKKPELFEAIRCVLPMGYLYHSTITMNYENVLNIIKQREHHKLSLWKEFCDVLKTLPYVKEFLGE